MTAIPMARATTASRKKSARHMVTFSLFFNLEIFCVEAGSSSIVSLQIYKFLVGEGIELSVSGFGKGKLFNTQCYNVTIFPPYLTVPDLTKFHRSQA